MSEFSFHQPDLTLYNQLVEALEGNGLGPELEQLSRKDPALLAGMQTRARSILDLFAEKTSNLLRGGGQEMLLAERVPEPVGEATHVRSAAVSFQELHEAGDFEVDISLTDEGALLGQVLPFQGDSQEFVGGSALWQNTCSGLSAAPVAFDGTFYLMRPARGTGRLVLSGKTTDIVIPELELPPA